MEVEIPAATFYGTHFTRDCSSRLMHLNERQKEVEGIVPNG